MLYSKTQQMAFSLEDPLPDDVDSLDSLPTEAESLPPDCDSDSPAGVQSGCRMKSGCRVQPGCRMEHADSEDSLPRPACPYGCMVQHALSDLPDEVKHRLCEDQKRLKEMNKLDQDLTVRDPVAFRWHKFSASSCTHFLCHSLEVYSWAQRFVGVISSSSATPRTLSLSPLCFFTCRVP